MRYALIKNGRVESVIVAEPSFIASADPRWLAKFDSIVEATKEAEPGATYDGAFTKAQSIEKTKEEIIEERLAALEAKTSKA